MKKTQKIHLFDPESKSDILKSSHIFVATVESARFDPWRSGPSRFDHRDGEVDFRIDEVWKGELEEDGDGPVRVEIRQYRPSGPRFVAVPGMWSGKEIEAGKKFAVFAVSLCKTVHLLFAEPSGIKAVEAEDAAGDFALAAADGSPPVPAGMAARRALAAIGSFDYLYAQYLSQRLPETLFGDPDGFRHFMRLAEDPRLSPRCRWILLTDTYSQLLMRDPAPMEFVEPLLTATFRILDNPEASALQSPMIETYIPNLVGLEGGAEHKPADLIYGNNTDMQRFAAQVMRKRSGVAGAPGIVQWLLS